MFSRPGAKHLSHFFHQLGTMYEAGVSVSDAINTMAGTSTHLALCRACRSMRAQLEQGLKLSTVFAMHPKCFSNLAVKLVEVGEESGTLDRIARELSRYYGWQSGLKNRVIAGLIFPGIQMTLALTVIGVFLYLMPRITGPDFSPFSENAAEKYATAIFVTIGALLVLWKSGKFFLPGRKAFHILLARGPFISRLYRKIALGRFSLVLHLMTSAGVNIVEAVKRAGAGTGNLAYEDACRRVASELLLGNQLSSALEKTNLFGPEYVAIIKVGETSGKLDETAYRLAIQYRDEAENAIKMLVTIMSFLIWALVAGFIVVMIMLIFKNFYSGQINKLLDETR